MKSIAMGAVAVLVSGAATGLWAEDIRRETPVDRPYIVEVGNPSVIDADRLAQEMKINRDLADHITYYGAPDLAETQEIDPEWPWASYEVRLFYLRYNQKLAFGLSTISPSEDYGLQKYMGLMSAAERERVASLMGMGGGDVYSRIEAAAERAARAAELAAADSRSAAEAAERAEGVATRMEADFHQQLRK